MAAIRERIDLHKVANYSVAINALQIAAVVAAWLIVMISGPEDITALGVRLLMGVASLVVIWGAILDIREAWNARRVSEESNMLAQAYEQLEQLNNALRAQRHDFLNHLQVVYSLTELEEYEELKAYTEHVYGDIRSIGKTMRTKLPAINALLMAKLGDCERKGIEMGLSVDAPWEGLPMPGWEMCRVLGNLIDNAMEALMEVQPRVLAISLGETVNAFVFRVANNGPMIPPRVAARIFEMGYTTKATGHGMGLHIVRGILEKYGGTINVTSDEHETCFTGSIPKKPANIAGDAAKES